MSASWLPNNANLLHFAAVAWWVAVALLLYVYAGYPLLLPALALFCRRRRPEPGCLPTLSILIAAHNEEAGIEKKLEQTLTLDYPPDKMEILVLSDGSTDRTDAIVESFADPRVRLVRVEPRLGKTHAQNFGARRAEVLRDRKSTRLNSSHSQISYAVFCLKKKKRRRTNRSCCAILSSAVR